MGKTIQSGEDKKRLAAVLRGAFAGPPTPLKDIPKKNGESRVIGKRKRKSKQKRREK